MALRALLRQIPVSLEAFTLQSCVRGKHVKTQPSFVGISAAGVWTESLGFGTGTNGSLVLVSGNQNRGLSADGYDYGMLFHTPVPRSEDLLPQLRKRPIYDRDLWTERQNLKPPTDRGNAPWARPVMPPRHGPCYSTLAGRDFIPHDLSLVIFDKDGTLIDLKTVWKPWMESYVEELEKKTGLQLEEALYECVGYCPNENKYEDNALLAHGTIAEIKESFRDVLVESGIDEEEAKEIVKDCYKDFDSGDEKTLEPLGDLLKIFETLKSKGIKTAICTADSRSGTVSALEKLGLIELIDEIVCGDDIHTKPKPHPESALGICRSLDICPTQAALIGDTTRDTDLGRDAGLGLTIGVLTGAGNKAILQQEANVVLDSVDDLLGALFPSEFGALA